MKHCEKKTMTYLIMSVLVLGMMLGLTGTALADENEYMWFGITENGYDIRGRIGSNYISTTFPGNGDGKGYYTMMQVGDNEILTFDEFEFNKVYESGGVKASVSVNLDNNAVQIAYHIKNDSNSKKTVKIGSCADAMIYTNDCARVRLQAMNGKNGIKMDYGPFVFWVLPGENSAFTTRWSGLYNDDFCSHVFDDGDNKIDADSALAWSWTVTLGAGESITKSALLSEWYLSADNAEYIDPNKCGIAKFTVIDSSDEEPIQDARIEIALSEKKKEILTTDGDGNAAIALPTGKHRVEVFANGKRPRILDITVTMGLCELPPIGLSDRDIVEAQLDVTEMTLEEIQEAGIDTSAPANNHVYKYEVHLEFSPNIDILNMFTYINMEGKLVGGDVDEGGGRWKFEPKGTYFYNDEAEITVYPVSETFYIIIYGEVRWLKEMFDVELLVINHSMTDTLTQCAATIDIPKGLGLAVMEEEAQQKSIEIGEISGGKSKSVHWYLTGDEEGTYRPSVHLTGLMKPYDEKIDRKYEVKEPLSVLGGSAMHLTYTVPDAAYYGKDYIVKAELENVSDKTLYNVESLITGVEEGRVTHYSKGKAVKKIYYKQDEVVASESAVNFEPGDKIVIELSIPIFFESEIIQNMKDQLETGVIMADNMMKAWKAYKTGADLLSELKGYSEVYDSITKRVMKRIDVKLDVFDKLTGSGKDIDRMGELSKYVKYMGGKDQKKLDEEFNIVKSVCEVIQSIPVRFDLISSYVEVIPGSTAVIPTTINTVHEQGEKWVVNPGRYLLDLIIALYGEDPDTLLPWPLSEMESAAIKDAMGYTRAVNYLKAVDGQLESISVYAPSPNTRCRTWTEKGNISISVRGDSAKEQGKIVFSGSSILDFVPTNGEDDTIYIDFGDGDVRKFNIEVSPEHEHSFEERYVLLNPTEKTSGIEIGICDVCGDVIDIVTTKKCKKHKYADWVEEIKPTAEYSGIRSRICQECHALEYVAVPYDRFTFGADQITILPGMKLDLNITDRQTGPVMNNGEFSWTSSNKKAASVKNGTLTARQKGKTEISICYADEGVQIMRCEVNVKKMKKLTAPASLKKVASAAFSGDSTVECVDLSQCNGIAIAKNAFEGCASLKLLLLPEKYSCKNIVLPNKDMAIISGQTIVGRDLMSPATNIRLSADIDDESETMESNDFIIDEEEVEIIESPDEIILEEAPYVLR